MAFPFMRFEEYRTAGVLRHLCAGVRASLPSRSRTGENLVQRCGEVSALIAGASAELTRRASIDKLTTSLEHADDIGRLLGTLRRRQRADRAYVTAGLEISERLREQIAHRIERLERRR